MTEEELEEYSQLNANEQIEKVEDLVKNLGGKYADIFATYKDVFYRTKPEAFEMVRKLLIDDIISMRQNYEKRKLGVLVKDNINYVNKELANQFDDMIFILLQGKDENETNQIKQEYITKYIKEKNFIGVVKVYASENQNSIDEFGKLYELLQSEAVDKYFDDCKDIETDEERMQAKEQGIISLIEGLIEGSSNNVFENDTIINMLIAEKDKFDFGILIGKMSAEKQIEHCDEIIRYLESKSESTYEFTTTLNSVKSECKNTEKFKAYLIPKIQEYIKSEESQVYKLSEILKEATPEIQNELKEDIENYLLVCKSYELANIWESISEEKQSDWIREILNKLADRYKDDPKSYEYSGKIASIWANTSKQVQSENSDLFFELYEKLKDSSSEFAQMWSDTKEQEKYFEELYTMLQNEDQDNFLLTKIDDIWEKTNENLQRKYIEMVLDDNPKDRISIFSKTNEGIQKEIFERKQQENISEKEFVDLYCGLSANLKTDKQDMFWKFFATNIQDNPELAIKLWENMGNQFQRENFYRAFEFVKVDDDLLLEFWKNTYKNNESIDIAKDLLEYSKNNIDLYKKIYNYSELNIEGLFEVAMEIQKDNFNNQLRLWHEMYEYNQKEHIEWLIKSCEEHKDNTKDILNLWNTSKAGIQKSNPQILHSILNSKDLPKAGYSYLLQNTTEELLTEDIMLKLMEKIDEKDASSMLERYNLLKKMNPRLNTSLNLSMLRREISDSFGIDKIVKLSTDVELQKKLEAHMEDKNFMHVISNVAKSSHNWVLEISTICRNLDEHSELMESIKDKNLDEKQLKLLYLCLLEEKNWFKVNSLGDLEGYSDKRRKICCEILEGKDVAGEMSEDFSKLTEDEKKIFAVLELSYGMDIETAKNLVYKYGKDIDQISKEQPQNKTVEELKVLSTILKLTGKEAEELYRDNQIKIQNWYDIEFSTGAHIEEQALELYEEMYRDALKAQEVQLESVQYQGKEVPVTEVVGDFKAFIRVEGAYSMWEEPEDFSTYFDDVDPYGNGNCKSFVANNLLARARPKGPTFGFNQCKENSFLLMAPWDIASNRANYSFSTSSANWDYKKGVQFRTPENMIDATRDNHNEVVTQKWFWNEQEQRLERDKPDFVIYMKTSLNPEEDPQYKMSIKAAAQLGIPMKIIDFEKNIQREQQRVIKYLQVLEGKIPNDTKMTDEQLIRRIILDTENNRVAMRFADEEYQSKYFTSETRDSIYDAISQRIVEEKDKNPEKYKVLKRCFDETMLLEEQKEHTSTGYATDSEREHGFYVRQRAKAMDTEKIEEFGCRTEIENEIRNKLENVSKLPYYNGNKAHSIEHIERVTLFSGILAEMECIDEESRTSLLAAAAFHDSGRAGRDGNAEHAEASAIQVKKYLEENPDNPFGITRTNIGIIQTAIHYHEHAEKNIGHIDEEMVEKLAKGYNVKEKDFQRTKKICELLKDADALDRCRFANRATLNPEFLRSKAARTTGMINFARNVNNEMAQYALINVYGKEKGDIMLGAEVAQLRKARIKRAESENYIEPTIPVQVLLEIIGLEKENEMQKSNEKLLGLYERYGVTKEDIQTVARVFEERMNGKSIEEDKERYER